MKLTLRISGILVDDGLIDSLELMKIIVALEEAYDVRIDAGEVEPENFNSAEVILVLVNSCRSRHDALCAAMAGLLGGKKAGCGGV